MAGGAFGGDEDAGTISEINVTPLVDVTLVLLIIFMVTAPMIVSQPSVKVALPKAKTAEETKKSTLALTLAHPSGGQPGVALFLNGEPIDEAALPQTVAPLVAANSDLQAIIAADKGIDYGEVVRILDLVRSLGVHKFALSTEQAR